MISVCMATYNGEKYIKEQLDSILIQLRVDDEVIISDDGSKDRTLDIVRAFNDNRIVIVINEKNHGYTGNFYNALKYANGDYIFLSDQDDVWKKNKVKKTMEYLSKVDFVVSDAEEVDEFLNVIDTSRFLKYNIKPGFFHSLLKCRYLGCCMAFRRSMLDAIFPVPSYKNDYPHDLWITLIGERYFKSAIIRESLIMYRRHGNNASNGGDDSKSKRTIIKKVVSRWFYFKCVFRQGRLLKEKSNK